MNLIHTSTIVQPSFWQKKGFTISTIGLMTEHGILLGELLEVISCTAYIYTYIYTYIYIYTHSIYIYKYVCVCVCAHMHARAYIPNSASVGKVQYMFCSVRCNGW